MITLDKIKIISVPDNIIVKKEEVFESIIKDGVIITQKYTILSPYNLYIEIKQYKQELILEFTGKILKDKYPLLINKDTIRECLHNINSIGICFLDVEAIINDGVACKIDVTKDVECQNCKQLTDDIKSAIGSHREYLVRSIGGNFVVEKNVVTRQRKKRLTVYDKSVELAKECNRNFLDSLDNKEGCIGYFEGKVRFELNLNSIQQIKMSLHINDTKVMTILCAKANPIAEFLDKILIDDVTPKEITKLSDYNRWQTLVNNGFDLSKVEGIVRRYSAKGTHICQAMKPYRRLLSLMTNYNHRIKDRLHIMLLEILIPIVFVCSL